MICARVTVRNSSGCLMLAKRMEVGEGGLEARRVAPLPRFVNHSSSGWICVSRPRMRLLVVYRPGVCWTRGCS
jgi:hypothetical protein